MINLVSFFDAHRVANLVLQDTIERIILSHSYSECHHGLFVIRGENVVLLGEVVKG
jgi:U6 snRNA-associated Sm-like protein LSm1